MKKCNACGQEIKVKVYRRGDGIVKFPGAVVLEAKLAFGMGQIILALMSGMYYIWYCNEYGEFVNGRYYLYIEKAVRDYEMSQ